MAPFHMAHFGSFSERRWQLWPGGTGDNSWRRSGRLVFPRAGPFLVYEQIGGCRCVSGFPHFVPVHGWGDEAELAEVRKRHS